MKPSAKNLTVASLAAILALGFVLYECRAISLARDAAREQIRHQADLEAKFRSAQRDLADAQRQEADLERAAEQAAAQSAATGESGTTADAMAAIPQSLQTWLASHPEARAQYLKDYRAALAASWGLLFQAMNLPAKEVGKLKDLLTQRADNALTLAEKAYEEGEQTSAPDIQALQNQLDAANKASIRQLVGKSDYATVHTYMQDLPVIPVVNQLASAESAVGTPLTTEQEMQVTAALANSSQKSQYGFVHGNTINWDQAESGVQAVLAPTQVATFALVQQQRQAQGRIQQIQQAATKP